MNRPYSFDCCLKYQNLLRFVYIHVFVLYFVKIMIVGAIHESPARNKYGKRNIRIQNETMKKGFPLGGSCQCGKIALTDEGFVN